MATGIKEFRFTPNIPFNAICPDCSRRYTAEGRGVGGYIDVLRCPRCVGGHVYRDYSTDGCAKSRVRRRRKSNYGVKPVK